MKTSAPKPRIDVLKVILSDDEDTKLRKLCNALGVQRSPFVRGLINSATRANVRPPRRRPERPTHGHVAFPSRAAFGGAPKPLRL